jgi:hypothetical protein
MAYASAQALPAMRHPVQVCAAAASMLKCGVSQLLLALLDPVDLEISAPMLKSLRMPIWLS